MKPGWKTSECWVHVVFVVIGLINQLGFLSQPIPADKIMPLAATIITYIFSRSILKAAAMYLDAKPVDAAKLNQ